MAKVAFNKLGLAQNKTVKTIVYNEQEIEIRQYLPISEKLQLISNVMNASIDESNFANPLKISVFTVIEIVEAYTNIAFTPKQREDACKLYDLLTGNNFAALVLKSIPNEELAELLTAIDDSFNAYYTYHNSAVGILEAVTNDYSSLSLDATEIQKKLADPENLELLKTVMNKLG